MRVRVRMCVCHSDLFIRPVVCLKTAVQPPHTTCSGLGEARHVGTNTRHDIVKLHHDVRTNLVLALDGL